MKRLAALLLPALLAAGCAGQPPRDRLLRDAEAQLRTAETHPDARARDEARRHYALLVHERARALETAGRPGEAIRLLEAGLDRLPGHPLLKNDLQRLQREKHEALASAALEQDLAEAEWLERRLRHDRLVRRWEGTDPIDALSDRLRARRLDGLLVSLRAQAAEAIRRKDRKTAETILALLERLRGRQYVEEELRAFEQAWPSNRVSSPPRGTRRSARVRSDAPRPRGRTRSKQDPSLTSLRQALTRALQEGDLQKSRSLAQTIARKKPNDPAIDDLVRAIEAAIQARISHLDELAGLAYRDQNYQAAAALWEQILRIDPENAEAKVRLERVQKVIANLEALQKQGTQEKADEDAQPDTRK